MIKNFRVTYYLRSGYKAKDGKVAVIVRISLNGERLIIGSAGFNVNPEQWDSEKSRVKGRSAEAQSINNSLERIESDLTYLYRRHEFDDNLSLALIKSEYLGDSKSSESFMEFFQQVIDKVHKEVGIERSYASYQKYNRLYKHFANFLQKRLHRSDIAVKDVNFRIISDFVDYLLEEGGCAHNTTMKMMGNFKTITIRARRLGLIDNDPFANFKIRFKKVDRGFLTDEEIENLMEKDFGVPRLNLVRDIFIFSCFTGLAYIDVSHLTERNIVVLDGKEWIMTKRQKTDVPSNILLLDIPKLIIEKYKGQDSKGRLLPILSNQKMNAYLKEIGDICGIEKRLTYHLARHSFATMLLSKGVPVESVSKMLGHTNIRTTQIYARITNKKIENDMLAVSEKLHFDTSAL